MDRFQQGPRNATAAPAFFTVDMSADDVSQPPLPGQQRPRSAAAPVTNPSLEQEAVAEKILVMLGEKDAYIAEQAKSLQLLRLEDQRLRRELHDCTEAKTTLFEQYQWLVKDVNERDDQIGSLQDKLELVSAEALGLRTLISEKDGAINLQNAALSEQAQKCETYRTKLESAERANEKLQRDLQLTSNQLASLREELRQGSTEIERIVATSQDAARSSQQMLQSQATRISELEEENRRLLQVEADDKVHLESMAKLRQSLTQASSEIEKLRQKLEDMEDTAHEHKYNHEAAKKENEMLALVLKQREEAIADLRRDVQALEDERQAAATAAIGWKNTSHELQLAGEKIAQLTQAVASSVVESEQLREQRDASICQMADLKMKVALLEDELRQSQERLDSQHHLFERHSAERQAVVQEASSLHGTLDEFEEQLDQAHRRTEQLVVELRHRTAEVEELQRRLYEESANHKRELLEQQELYTSIASAQAERIQQLSDELQSAQETASQLSVSVQRHEDGRRIAVESKEEMERYVSDLQQRAIKLSQLEQAYDKLELAQKMTQRESAQHKSHVEQLRRELEELQQKHHRAVQRTRIHEDACKRLAAERISIESGQPTIDELLTRNAQQEAKIKSLEQRYQMNQETVRASLEERKHHLQTIDGLQNEIARMTNAHQTEVRRLSDRHRSELFRLTQQLQATQSEKEALDFGHQRIAEGLRKIVTQVVDGLSYVRNRGEVTAQTMIAQVDALEELLETVIKKSRHREHVLQTDIADKASRLQWCEEELVSAKSKVKGLKTQLRAKARQALQEIDVTANAVIYGTDMNLTVSSASVAPAASTWPQPKSHLVLDTDSWRENAAPPTGDEAVSTTGCSVREQMGVKTIDASSVPADLLQECDHLSQFLGVAGGYRELLSLSRSVHAPSSVAPNQSVLDSDDAGDDHEEQNRDENPIPDALQGVRATSSSLSDLTEEGRKSGAAGDEGTLLLQRLFTSREMRKNNLGEIGQRKIDFGATTDVAEAARRRSVIDRLVRLRTDIMRRWLLHKFLSLFGLTTAPSPNSQSPTVRPPADDARVRELLFSDVNSEDFIPSAASIVEIDRAVAQARDDQQRDDELLHWFSSLSESSQHARAVHGATAQRLTVASLVSRPELAGFHTVSELICAFADSFIRCPVESLGK